MSGRVRTMFQMIPGAECPADSYAKQPSNEGPSNLVPVKELEKPQSSRPLDLLSDVSQENFYPIVPRETSSLLNENTVGTEIFGSYFCNRLCNAPLDTFKVPQSTSKYIQESPIEINEVQKEEKSKIQSSSNEKHSDLMTSNCVSTNGCDGLQRASDECEISATDGYLITADDIVNAEFEFIYDSETDINISDQICDVENVAGPAGDNSSTLIPQYSELNSENVDDAVTGVHTTEEEFTNAEFMCDDPGSSETTTASPDTKAKRRSIHDNQNASEDEEIVRKMKCQDCSNWYSIDPNNKEKKLNIDVQSDELLEEQNDQQNNFICSNCSNPLFKLLESIKPWQTKISESFKSYAIIYPKTTITVIVLSLIICYFSFFGKREIPITLPNRTESEVWLDNEMDRLEKIHVSQSDELWYTFASGIKSVLREDPHQPAVFLLVFDNDDAGKTAECLAKQVSDVATSYLMGSTRAPIMFNDYDINSIKDPGELIPMLEYPINSRGAMILTNLQDIKPQIAEKLHFFCDKYSPVVEKAVYFITLKVDGFRYRNVQTDAEEKLKHLWFDHMKEHVFQPLITRLTPSTLKILKGKSHC